MSTRREGAHLAKRAGVELAATGVGLLAGGPFGALAGAAAAPVVELVLVRERHALRNMERLVEMVTELSGVSSEEFVAWAQERDGRLYLATSAFQAASAAQTQHKLRALASVLADNLRDDARLDMASLTVAGLAKLEPAHVQVLRTLVHQVPPDALNGRLDQGLGWSCAALKEQLPGLADGIMPILGTLTRAGMACEASASTNERIAWVATQFGIMCMNHLHDMQDPLR